MSAEQGWRQRVLLDLAFFLNLPEAPEAGWQVRRPTMVAYKAAVNLITEVNVPELPLPRMAPDREGGVQFEWDFPDGSLEIEVSANGAYEALQADKTGRSTEGPVGISKARDLIASLAR